MNYRMKTLTILLVAVQAWAAAPAIPVSAPAGAITLQECFERARRLNETVSISAENTRMLHEQTRAEIGSVLPRIDWIKSQFYQEKVETGSGGVGGSLARPT